MMTRNMLSTMKGEIQGVEHSPPTLYDVELTIRKLHLKKSAGPNGIRAELIKINETKLNRAIHIICCMWIQYECQLSWICLCIYIKNGDKPEFCNYRGITLLNTAYKIFSIIIYTRPSLYTSKVIGNYQSGFQREEQGRTKYTV